jgi:hypothetical protein
MQGVYAKGVKASSRRWAKWSAGKEGKNVHESRMLFFPRKMSGFSLLHTFSTLFPQLPTL